jgi:hypothetical protein
MKKLDRIILIALVVGVWGLLGTVLLKPNTVDAHADDNHSLDYAEAVHLHDTYDIFSFTRKVKIIIENCNVDFRGSVISC